MIYGATSSRKAHNPALHWRLRLRDKLQHLLHYARTLVRIEEELGMGRAVDNNQLLRIRSLRVVPGNLRQARPRAAAVLACNEKQLASRELLWKVATGRAQQDD